MAPPEKLLHGELAQKIEEALAELPENQRTAILLCRQDELSYEEIAEVLDCSLSATKSLIHRGRETLKEKLKPYLQTGEWQQFSVDAAEAAVAEHHHHVAALRVLARCATMASASGR
jgi:predicted DNA-binding protein YlxM (UPF0122 family)